MGSNISLKNYLSRHFAVVAVLPVITIACLVYGLMLPVIKARTGLQHQAMARSIAGQISTHLVGGKRQISAIAEYLSNRQLKNYMAPVDLLDSYCGDGEFFEALFVIDNKDGLIQTAGLNRANRIKRSDFIGLDFSGRKFIHSMEKDQKTVWSQIFLSTVNSRPAVAVTIPLAKGVIIGEMALENLSAFIRHLPVESELLTLVVDEHGKVLADSLGRHWGQILKDDFIAGTESNGSLRPVSKIFKLNGRNMLGTVADMDETGWKILIAQPIGKAFQSLWNILALIGIGLFLALIFSLFVGRFLAGTFSFAVETYIKRASSIANGNYDVQWPEHKTREFSLLSQNFKRMVQKINTREEELRLAKFSLDKAPIGIWRMGPNGEVLDVNEQGCNSLGYLRGELCRMSVFDFDTDQSIEVWTEMVNQLHKTGSVVREMHHRRKNGEVFPIQVITAIMYFETQEYYLSFVQDISHRKQMEELIIQNEKMLSVGGLAAGMAHEINNPLAGMMQTAQVMAQRLTSNIDIFASRKAAEEAGTSLETIERFMEARGIPRMIQTIIESGQRVADIVNNILSFSRKDETILSAHHLDKILDKSVELAATDYNLKKAYDFKQIKITRLYDTNLPEVPCQAGKIQQVVLNILANGAMAMQEAGTLNPEFILRTYEDKARNMICVEIQDNGPGMDEKIRKHIFDPFFTTKPVGVGTGLGLSVSYFIITENHKGEMAVESRPGAGAKFIIRLQKHLTGRHGNYRRP